MFNKMQVYNALPANYQEAAPPLLAGELAVFESSEPGPWRERQIALARRRAGEYLASPTPALPYSLFRLYKETGDRLRYQAPYYERRGRLQVFSLMALLEPEEPKWLAALEDIVWDICAEPFWCIPAHFTGGDGLPLPFELYATQLDLFSSETAFALAETLALHERRLAPEVVRQTRLMLERRVFAPFLDGDVFFRFEAMPNNWAAVCGGAIGSAALCCLRDRARLAALLHRCLSCLDVYLGSFGADGVCVEGVDYWTYGFGFFTCFADLLEKYTDGRLNLFADEKVAAIARSQQYYHITGPYTLSFSDGSDRSGFRMGLSCYLQKRFPDAAIPDEAYADDLLRDPCHRYCLALRDLLWYDPRARFGLPESSAVWLGDAQWFLSRTGRLALAAKAGNNGEMHNHNDCGSFMLYKDGQPLLCDLGAGLYDAAYFGPNRYDIFCNASRSHNVPLVAGREQRDGAQFSTRGVEASLDGCRTLSMELCGCYDVPQLRSLRRTIRHDAAAGCVSVADAFVFDSAQTATEVFLSLSPIRLTEEGAVFAREGAEAALSFDSASWEAALREETYADHQGRPRTAYLLHLSPRSPAQKLLCEICIR